MCGSSGAFCDSGSCKCHKDEIFDIHGNCQIKQNCTDEEISDCENDDFLRCDSYIIKVRGPSL